MLFGGPCEAILGLARAGLLDLYDSPAIERELRRVLREKFHWTGRQVRDAVLEPLGRAHAPTDRPIVHHQPSCNRWQALRAAHRP